MDSAGAPAFQEMGEDEKFHMYTLSALHPKQFLREGVKDHQGGLRAVRMHKQAHLRRICAKYPFLWNFYQRGIFYQGVQIFGDSMS
jgi:hypothetical protein